MLLEDRVAIVTGASRGIGAATAQELDAPPRGGYSPWTCWSHAS